MWKAIKWATYTLLSGVLVKLIINIAQGSSPPEAPLTPRSILQHLAQRPQFVSSLLVLSIICCVAWLVADRQESLQQLARTAFFVPSHSLTPDELSIQAYSPFYCKTPEALSAERELATQGRVLILGRPAGGKTRLLYNLAAQTKDHWVLRLQPGFSDWRNLSFPRVPPRCKVLWILDDLDKFLGKLDLVQAHRVLRSQCQLKVIATCRLGPEFAMVRTDSELASFTEQLLPGITCPDLNRDELLLLAQKTGMPLDASSYDGTPGSVTLGLDAMKRRLKDATAEEQSLMKALFLMRTALIYEPSQQLSTAVLSNIYKMKRAEEKVEAAASTLTRDGFLREGEALIPTHDCYLTPDFYRYYPVRGNKLDQDLVSLGSIVQTAGTTSDFVSIGTFWGTKTDWKRALPFLRKAATQMPAEGRLGFSLSLALYWTGDKEGAIGVLKKVTAADPYDLEALCNLTIFQFTANVPGKETLETVAQLRSSYNLHRVSGEPSARVRRSIAGAFVVKGLVLSKLGRYEDAIQAYDYVIDAFGKSDPPIEQPVADALFYKASVLVQLNRKTEARTAWDELLRRFSSSTEVGVRQRVASAAVNLGASLIDDASCDAALPVLSNVVKHFCAEQDPKLLAQVGRALVQKAYALSELTRYEEAIACCDETLRRFGSAGDATLKASVARALIQKAFVLNELKEREEAIACCEEVVHRIGENTPGVLEFYLAKALLQKSVLLMSADRVEGAREALAEIGRRYGSATDPKLEGYVKLAKHGFELLSMTSPGLVVDLLKIPLTLHEG